MKNIDATAKFNFKKTTITVFSKQIAGQVKFGSMMDTSSHECVTVMTATQIDTTSCFGF